MDQPLRIMSYNVHSCIGTDRQLSHLRIAEVIAEYQPDLVALQELDLARPRTGGIDQARVIAEHLKMSFHFNPAVRIKEEQYGHAILSKWPLVMRRATVLPTLAIRLALEPRGALWVTIEIAGREVQIINTHLGLLRAERLAQVEALLGGDWLGSPACTAPRILCGDFNALPRSLVYRRITAHLRDAQRAFGAHRTRPTFPSIYPMLRLDYVFLSEEFQVRAIEVPRTPLTRRASDHLPLIVDLHLS